MSDLLQRANAGFVQLNSQTNGWFLYLSILVVFVLAALRFGKRQ